MSAETEVILTTYRQADGEPVAGEYDFVMTEEFWTEDELDEPVEVLKEVWVRRSVETITYRPETTEEDEDS